MCRRKHKTRGVGTVDVIWLKQEAKRLSFGDRMWTLSPGRGISFAGDVSLGPRGTLYATEPNKKICKQPPYALPPPPFATLACSEIWEASFQNGGCAGKRIQPQLATATHCLGFEHPALSKAEASTP